MTVIIKLTNLGMPLSMPFLTVMAAGAGASAIMAVQASNNSSRGSVLFASMLVLFMCLPWGFIGMRFQALMVMGFAAIAVSGGIFALVFYPAFSIRNSTNECTSVEEVTRQ
jgi:hypothetical protein